MAASSSGSADVSGTVEQVSHFIARVEMAFAARLERLAMMPQDAAALTGSLREGGTSWPSIMGIAGASAAAVAISVWLAGRFLATKWSGRPFASAVVIALVGLFWVLVLAVAVPSGIERGVARLWAFAAAAALLLALLVRAIVVRDQTDADQGRIGNTLAFIAACALVAVAVQTTLRRLGAGAGLLDATSLAIGITITAAFSSVYVLERQTVRRALIHGRDISPVEWRLATAWPWLAAALVLITFVVLQISVMLAGPVPGLLVLTTVLFLLLSPHLDQAITLRIGETDESMSVLRSAARRTARSAFWAFVICCLGMLWISPLSIGLGYPRGLIIIRGLDVAVLALAAVYIWHLVGAVGDRARGGDKAHSANGESRPATRLATLAPIITVTVQVMIVALALLSILIALGVNAWPFVAGLSVFGLAIGFGSQSLVKDIVSGVFFLLDDAFRFGEYIETSQAKGTVERISIRSVALRHPRGALATVPYGSIGKVVNFSRDWVIDKIAFRVAFDTDVEVVRKLFKKIGQEIAADPELGPDLIQPFKSQGVFAVDDGTLVVRAKFMAKAGRQFMIRKAILAAVHRGFRENGIVPVAKFPQASAN